MREILFRAKREDNGEWVCGYYVHLPDAAGAVHILHVPAKNPDERNNAYYINSETLGQYTGLTDKNGTKIFEGDIIQDGNCEYNKYVVEYSLERGGFLPFAHGDGCGCCETATLYDSTCHTVIGNIYDSPELIGGN